MLLTLNLLSLRSAFAVSLSVYASNYTEIIIGGCHKNAFYGKPSNENAFLINNDKEAKPNMLADAFLSATWQKVPIAEKSVKAVIIEAIAQRDDN